MAVRVSKPAFNLRDKLSQLDIPVGSHGGHLLGSNSLEETFNHVRAGRRNLIINGAMEVAQRTQIASASAGGTSQFLVLDRWSMVANSSITYAVTMSQETDGPPGFKNSIKLLTTSASTPSGSENYILRQSVEQQFLNPVKFGTSQCEPVTLSFWVKSNKTGIYGHQMYLDNIGSTNNSRMTQWTIENPDVWEYKVIKVPPFRTAYTQSDQFNRGMMIDWHLASGPDDKVAEFEWTVAGAARAPIGQVNLLDAANNYIQFTGMQLELGSQATPYDHRSWAEELALCQRYFQKSYDYDVPFVWDTSGADWSGPDSSHAQAARRDHGAICGRNYSDSAKSQNTMQSRFTTSMRVRPTITAFAPHTGNKGNSSAGGSNPESSDNDKGVSGFRMLGETGFSGLQTSANLGANDWQCIHFMAHAEF